MKPDLPTRHHIPAAFAAAAKRLADAESHRVESIARAALHASVYSMEAHADALGRAEYPGPGWWEISHIQHRWGHPARVVMRWRLPLRGPSA